MSTSAPGPGAMETIVRLRRGVTARTVCVTIVVHAEHWSALAIARVFGAFACGVEAGILTTERVELVPKDIQERHEGPWSMVRWEVNLPKMAPDSVAVLARMVSASLPGARRFEVVERAPTPTLVVRTFEDDGNATIADVPWRIVLSKARAPAVHVVFHEPAMPGVLEQTVGTLRAWTALVELGGFRGPHGAATSRAAFARVRRTDLSELVAVFDFLSCAHEALEALFQALLPIDALAPIAMVEVASQEPE